MSTDLSDKSNEFRHGYLTCVEDMRAWFFFEQTKFAAERKRLKRQLEEEKANFKRKQRSVYGYHAGVRDVLALPLRQIADLKRQIKSDGQLSPVVRAVRSAVKQRVKSVAQDGSNRGQDFGDALREARTSQEESAS